MITHGLSLMASSTPTAIFQEDQRSKFKPIHATLCFGEVWPSRKPYRSGFPPVKWMLQRFRVHRANTSKRSILVLWPTQPQLEQHHTPLRPCATETPKCFMVRLFSTVSASLGNLSPTHFIPPLTEFKSISSRNPFTA